MNAHYSIESARIWLILELPGIFGHRTPEVIRETHLCLSTCHHLVYRYSVSFPVL